MSVEKSKTCFKRMKLGKKAIIISILVFLFPLFLLCGCDQSNTIEIEDSSSSAQESHSSSAAESSDSSNSLRKMDLSDSLMPNSFIDSAKKIYKHWTSYNSYTGFDDLGNLINDLSFFYQITDGGTDGGFTIASKKGGTVNLDEQYFVMPTKETKVFLDGEPAKIEDLKPGYLVSIFGDGVAVTQFDGSADESFIPDIFDVELVNAWSANN